MSRATLHHTWIHGISAEELELTIRPPSARVRVEENVETVAPISSVRDSFLSPISLGKAAISCARVRVQKNVVETVAPISSV